MCVKVVQTMGFLNKKNKLLVLFQFSFYHDFFLLIDFIHRKT